MIVRNSMAFALCLSALSSYASQELATKNACMACHNVERKVLGPAFNEVAKKYTADKKTQADLAASIKKGGSGKWGAIPMPAQTTLSDADAQELAKWILSNAK